MSDTSATELDGLVRRVEKLTLSNGIAVSRFGARVIALSKFADAVVPQLTGAQCTEIAQRFRQGIEDAMSCTDDVAMPGEYHETLLQQTNILLKALGREGAIED